METQALLNILFACCGGLGGFILKAVWNGLTELRKANAELAILVAGKYVTWDGLRGMRDQLTRIEGKLDGKANSSDCAIRHAS